MYACKGLDTLCLNVCMQGSNLCLQVLRESRYTLFECVRSFGLGLDALCLKVCVQVLTGSR